MAINNASVDNLFGNWIWTNSTSQTTQSPFPVSTPSSNTSKTKVSMKKTKAKKKTKKNKNSKKCKDGHYQTTLSPPSATAMPRIIADLLKEKKLSLLHRVVRIAGSFLAWEILKETLEVERKGGEFIPSTNHEVTETVTLQSNGNLETIPIIPKHKPRRRTPGGVFFNLLKARISKEAYAHIYELENRKKKDAKKKTRYRKKMQEEHSREVDNEHRDSQVRVNTNIMQNSPPMPIVQASQSLQSIQPIVWSSTWNNTSSNSNTFIFSTTTESMLPIPEFNARWENFRVSSTPAVDVLDLQHLALEDKPMGDYEML